METAQVMPKHPLFSIVAAKTFFDRYCPEVRNVKHKLRGKDGNGNPIDFSPEDKKQIRSGVRRMINELQTMELFGNS